MALERNLCRRRNAENRSIIAFIKPPKNVKKCWVKSGTFWLAMLSESKLSWYISNLRYFILRRYICLTEFAKRCPLWTQSRRPECIRSYWIIAAGAYPRFLARSISTPPGRDASPSQSFPRNLLGFPNNFLVPIYTPGWREALWELSVLPMNTTQCPRPGLEPGSLALGTSALTMRSPRLPHIEYFGYILLIQFYQIITVEIDLRRLWRNT